MTLFRSAARTALATCFVLPLAHCGARATLEGGNVVTDAGGGAPGPDAGASPDATTPLSCPAAGPAVCVTEAGDDAPDAPDEAQPVSDGGPFMCGPITCVADEYCADHVPSVPHADAGELADTFICVPAPLGCQQLAPTCACVESSFLPSDACSAGRPGVICSTDAEGNVTIRCQGI